MNELKCKFCGKKFDSYNLCYSSPTKRHIALQNGENCVYCGKKFDNYNLCNYSPTKRHLLDSK